VSELPVEGKSYKIGEVCRMADVQPYVLRYWETEFPPLAPNKSGGGQRMYSKREIEIILRIKNLLYSEGFTIAGAKKRLEQELASGEEATTEQPATEPKARKRRASAAEVKPGVDLESALESVKGELRDLLEMLRD
jgi:DNA-binding transcriptional MerR regulator